MPGVVVRPGGPTEGSGPVHAFAVARGSKKERAKVGCGVSILTTKYVRSIGKAGLPSCHHALGKTIVCNKCFYERLEIAPSTEVLPKLRDVRATRAPISGGIEPVKCVRVVRG